MHGRPFPNPAGKDMHAQLKEIVDEFTSARARLDALARRVPDDDWGVRRDPERWSVSENIEHLNLLDEECIPVIEQALAQARAAGGPAPRRYRRDLLGWFLWRIMPPPVRFMRTRSKPGFVPTATLPPEQIRARFERIQDSLLALTAASDGLPIDRIRIVSPVDPRARYNLFAALGILARHQHRHLWQAEQSLES
jgi:hypothetical protein